MHFVTLYFYMCNENKLESNLITIVTLVLWLVRFFGFPLVNLVIFNVQTKDVIMTFLSLLDMQQASNRNMNISKLGGDHLCAPLVNSAVIGPHKNTAGELGTWP